MLVQAIGKLSFRIEGYAQVEAREILRLAGGVAVNVVRCESCQKCFRFKGDRACGLRG
jgi:hypothetical protein